MTTTPTPEPLTEEELNDMSTLSHNGDGYINGVSAEYLDRLIAEVRAGRADRAVLVAWIAGGKPTKDPTP